MQGMVQSLNVSVAGAICLSEIYHYRLNSNKSWQLTSKEQKQLIKDFLKR